jgi:hypothetical protein
VRAGQGSLPGVLTSDAYVFTSNAARSLEYPVASEQLDRCLAQLPEVGPGGRPGVPQYYTAQPEPRHPTSCRTLTGARFAASASAPPTPPST